MVTIKFEADRSRSAAYDDGREIGECCFDREDGFWIITHTGVDPAYGGRGIAGKLLDNVVQNARFDHQKLRPLCSYAAHAFETNPAYRDLQI